MSHEYYVPICQLLFLAGVEVDGPDELVALVDGVNAFLSEDAARFTVRFGKLAGELPPYDELDLLCAMITDGEFAFDRDFVVGAAAIAEAFSITGSGSTDGIASWTR
ncbi:MAG: hypothetical protein HQ592_02375 [Planctomycetes bacterium]|nr:hypothetical protein [Planctomycetota bacterium]